MIIGYNRDVLYNSSNLVVMITVYEKCVCSVCASKETQRHSFVGLFFIVSRQILAAWQWSVDSGPPGTSPRTFRPGPGPYPSYNISHDGSGWCWYINDNMTEVYWWDPWSTIYSSTVRIRHGYNYMQKLYERLTSLVREISPRNHPTINLRP